MSHRQLRPSSWILLGVVLALVLRAPWIGAALGRDEGGLALVAANWHGAGPFAYGEYFVDRPPLLVELFRLADGPLGIRLLGALAAAAAVVLTGLIARRVGGPRAVPGAVLACAVLVSSAALGSVFTPAELLGIVPSAASVLLLLVAVERPSGGLRLFAAAGALAVVALLVKQSFGDALLAGAAVLAVLAWTRRAVVARAFAWCAGAGAAILALDLWETLGHFPDGSVAYAIFGFRLDAVTTLSAGDIGMKLERLPLPALGSGLVVALLCAAVAVRGLRGRPLVLVVMLAWLAGAMGGVALGGSYWAHYLIALAPVAAVGCGMLVSRSAHPRLVLGAVLVPALVVSAVAVAIREPAHYQRDAVTVASYVSERARPHETAYVLYARANVLYYSGLRSPYPYEWSLMVRALPHARARLRALLASPQRPTWVVEWQEPSAFGLDGDGAIRRLLDREYGERTSVCGHEVLLARSAPPRPLPVEWRNCEAGYTAG